MTASSRTEPLPQTVTADRLILPLALLVFLLKAPSDWVLYAYIVLGQAHFVLTYIYQWRKGSYSRKGLAKYIACIAAAAIFMVACLVTHKGYFIFGVSFFFILHSFFDDLHLMRTPPNRDALLAAIPYLSLATIVSSDSNLQTHQSQLISTIAVGAYLAVLGYVLYRRLWHKPYIFYALSTTPIMFALYYGVRDDATNRIFGFIILSHYLNWYVYIFNKLKATMPENIESYVFESIAVNFLSLAGFLLCFFATGTPWVTTSQHVLFGVVYFPASFYVWTLMHLIVTLRKSDYAWKS